MGAFVSNLIGVNCLSDDAARELFDRAAHYDCNRGCCNVLSGSLLVNFFFEESTRTRMSFEIAAKRMGAEVVNVNAKFSSVSKGEDFLGSIQTIMAYSPRFVVVRHPESGIFNLLKGADYAGIINAGDGSREHPTQALGDAYTILKAKGCIAGLRVALCGDIENSRVARSNIMLLRRLGADVCLITPPISTVAHTAPVDVYHDFETGLRGVDVVMCMRHKREYIGKSLSSSGKCYAHYKISRDVLRLANPGVIVMHAGPVIRDVDIDSEVCDDPSLSVILRQVEHCMFVRQALLDMMCT